MIQTLSLSIHYIRVGLNLLIYGIHVILNILVYSINVLCYYTYLYMV